MKPIKPAGERRYNNREDVEQFAALNPDLLQDSDTSTSSGPVKPIKAHNPKSSNKSTTRKSKKEEQTDFSIYDKVLSEDLEDNKNIIEEQSTASIEDPSKGRTDTEFIKNLKSKYNPDELQESADNNFVISDSLISTNAEKLLSTNNRKLAEIKALEAQVSGYRTIIERDFNNDWIVYKLPSAVKNFNSKDSNLKSIGSGIFIDNNDDIWYLNIENNSQFLVHAGNLTDSVSLSKPENYDLIKHCTQGTGLYHIEGSDLKYLFSSNLAEELGLVIINEEKNIVKLDKFSKKELQDLFITNGINVLISEIYKTGA